MTRTPPPDHVAVERACEGDHTIRLTQAERAQAVARLHAKGFTDPEIADTLGVTRETARRNRTRQGLPHNHNRDAA